MQEPRENQRFLSGSKMRRIIISQNKIFELRFKVIKDPSSACPPQDLSELPSLSQNAHVPNIKKQKKETVSSLRIFCQGKRKSSLETLPANYPLLVFGLNC